MALSYPTINGNRYSFASIEVNASGVVMKGYEAVNYSDKCEPGEARGTHQQSLGTTRGEYSAEGSLEMHRAEYEELKTRLGSGFMNREFNTTVAYADDGQAVVVDELLGCRIKGNDSSNQKGSDPSKVKVDLYIRLIRWNGTDPIPNALG